MKKYIISCVLILALLAFVQAKTQAANIPKIKKSDINLQEIILDTNQCALDNEIISDSQQANTKIVPEETAIVNETGNPNNSKNKFLNILNLKGNVQKIDGTVEDSVKKTYWDVENDIEKLDEVLKAKITKPAVKQWLDGDYATGKYLGTRPLLESHGLTITPSFLYSPFGKTDGGANERESIKGYGLFNLGVNFDTEKAGLWKGGTFFGLYQRKAGYGLSGPNGGAMGDFMGFDGWDWREMNQISEYWYQQKFFNNKLRLKLGKQDANTDFCYLNSGWDFMNSGLSVVPNVPMPTYPDPGFGFMAAFSPKEWITIKEGIYSRFSNPFNINEIEIKPKIKNLPGRYILGAWELSDSNGVDVPSGIDSNGDTYYNNFNRNFGFYTLFEQMLFKENKNDENDMQGLVAFGQFSMSPSNRNDMARYVGGGLHYLGPIPKRDKDIAGVAVASGNFATRLGSITGQVGDETVIEGFYRVQVTPWFYVQPDVQYIMNPEGVYNNSVAIGIRSVITF